MKTYRLKAAVVLAVVAAGLWAMRAEAAGAVRGEIKAVIVTKAPAIDGTMADAQWQQGAELVFGPTKEGKIDPNSGTTGRVLFDDQNIYIGVTCKAKDIKAQVAQRDGQVWDDDCIELFVSPDLSEGYYHIIVNALGTIYDEYCGAFVKKVEKNLGIVVKATMKQGESWTVTLAIPLDAVNTYFGENLPWRLNVTRTQGAHGGEKARELSWADLGTDNFHTPDRFGRITDLNMKQRRDNAFLPQPPGKTGQQLGKRGTAEAVMVPKGPEIDGSMKDPIWAKGTLVVLGDPNSEDGDPLQRTAARVLFDAKNFYIGIFCRDELTGSLVAQKTARDSDVWSDDCVEIYAAPDADEEWYQFIVNSKGALFDQKVAKGRKDKSYNANAQLKASVENERGWCVTMAIPLTDLNAYVGEKLSWRFNITRYRQKRTQGEKADEYSWSKIGPNGFADPLSFGAITGISIPKTADGVTREMDPELINYKPRAKQGEVELLATADIWLSDCGEEKLNSMGAAPHFKIKSVQEVACIRFDVTPLRGKEIKKATLYMRREGTDQLRRFPIFTVGQTWTEGTTKDDYGKGSGSCFAWADFDTKKPWAWPVSDSIMIEKGACAWADPSGIPSPLNRNRRTFGRRLHHPTPRSR